MLDRFGISQLRGSVGMVFEMVELIDVEGRRSCVLEDVDWYEDIELRRGRHFEE